MTTQPSTPSGKGTLVSKLDPEVEPMDPIRGAPVHHRQSNGTTCNEEEFIDAVALIASRLSGAGCFTETVERLCDGALRVLGAASDVRCYPNSIQIQPNVAGARFRMRRFDSRISASVANKAQRALEDIIKNPEMAANGTWLETKVQELRNVQPIYPTFIQYLAWVFSGVAVNFLFFECSWRAMALTLVCSNFTFAAAALVPSLSPTLTTASGFLGAFTSAFVSKSAVSLDLVDERCFTGVVISSIISLVPGTGITIGIADLVSGHSVTGSARLTGGKRFLCKP